ncbi:unnamed protein product [Penicillium bialowiezense]
MIKDDCALWVDCQPDTSALTDFNHLVLLLKDDGDARKTEADEPMTEETWSMEGTNPTAYKAEWAPLQGAAAIEVLPIKDEDDQFLEKKVTRPLFWKGYTQDHPLRELPRSIPEMFGRLTEMGLDELDVVDSPPPEVVRMSSEFARQLEVHQGDLMKNNKGVDVYDRRFAKKQVAASADWMTTDHRDHCYLPAGPGRLTFEIFEICKVPGYHVFCGPKLKNVVPNLSAAKIGVLAQLKKRPVS